MAVFFPPSVAAIVLPEYWNILSNLRLVAMNGSGLSLYFLHSNTSGRSQLDDAPASAMAVSTFLAHIPLFLNCIPWLLLPRSIFMRLNSTLAVLRSG